MQRRYGDHGPEVAPEVSSASQLRGQLRLWQFSGSGANQRFDPRLTDHINICKLQGGR